MPATLIAPPPSAAEWPANRKWTREQFQDLSSQGFFESTRAILIHGDILEQGPMNAPHATGVRKVDKVLNRIFGDGFDVRNQLPLNLEADTEPRPDAAVVSGSTEHFAEGHPTTAVLIVEVSDTTLRFDTGSKASLYAEAHIEDYWVVDVLNRKLIAFRNPIDGDYAERREYEPNESLAPLAAPDAVIAVADLLP